LIYIVPALKICVNCALSASCDLKEISSPIGQTRRRDTIISISSLERLGRFTFVVDLSFWAGVCEMPEVYRGVVLLLSSLRLAPHILVLLCSPSREVVWADLMKWRDVYHLGPSVSLFQRLVLFLRTMTFYPEFRNVFYLRTGKPLEVLLSLFCRPLASLKIKAGRVGPGLFILHGTSTWVAAVEIGENCWISQHVVVGYTNDLDHPTIGNNVKIFPGAKIAGKVVLGDNSSVAANSVVIDDVPAGVMVMGVPARVKWRDALPERGDGAEPLRGVST
jgi:serine O-acetyltransferase